MEAFMSYEDFEKAEANGVSYANAYARFYIYGWSVERTITEPVKSRKTALWPRYKEIAEQSGVSQSRFYQRIASGWSARKAASLTLQKAGPKEQKRVFTKELLDLAASNGISEKTLRTRYYAYRWSLEKASTTPIKTQHRRKDYEASSAGHIG